MMISPEDEAFLSASDVLPVTQFLEKALAAKRQGNRMAYDTLIHQLRTQDDQETLWRVYIGLSKIVSIFIRSEDYRELVQALFAFDWKNEEKVSVAFLYLLGQIVSSNVTYLLSAFQFLCKSFVPSASIAATNTGIALILLGNEK